ncbi:hypothetical protein ASG89_17615 [Paenibacillus sp. Soil766]|uniref:S-layer homology domain-containing protein n=1 Tax=Paenibacillus sp. Soil766 TaxID=1736404 RepID=UPI00070EAD28|nr:S-layer homology domain-containing protein [Paenibacillus sp. Soil766]KRF07163.1 hypothetical protein ASG89_17615 [Paenibacillus sp. Soil766]
MNLKSMKLKLLSSAMALSLIISAVAPLSSASASTSTLTSGAYITDAEDHSINTLTLGQSLNLKLRDYTRVSGWVDLSDTTFHSADSGVLAVSSEGSLYANNIGTSVVTATYGGDTKTRSIQVIPPYNLRFGQFQFTVNAGSTQTFTLTGQASFGPNIDYTARATYTSSSPDVVTVDNTGKIRGLKAGTATITATLADRSATAEVRVASSASVQGTEDPQVIAQRTSSLALWNSIRSAMGYSVVTENTLLVKAAQNHSNYLGVSSAQASKGHSETAGDVGFTGSSSSERTAYVGYQSRGGVGEVVHYIPNDNNQAIQGLIDAPYHRVLMLDPNAFEVGIGIHLAPPVSTVANIGYVNSDTKTVSYYPYPNQQGVPTYWHANETPNPLQPHGKAGAKVGYPITVSVTGFGDVTFINATIKDASGTDIPFYLTDKNNSGRGSIVITPKSPLSPNTTYTVNFNGSTEGLGDFQKTWSFTTKGESLGTLSAMVSGMVLSVGRPQSNTIYYKTDDGYTDVTSQATFTSSNPALTVSNGVFTSTEPFTNATVTATYKGLSFTIAVSAEGEAVKPKLPTTVGDPSKVVSTIPSNYQTVNKQMKDVSSHWAEKEIAWAISQNIAQGYEDHSFKPNGDVTEAEFLAFVLRALKSDPKNVDLTETNSWSDGVYNLAKKYNLPLTGYSNQKSRDTKITRQQVANIIASVDGQALQGDASIKYLLNKNYSQGKTSATVEGYKGNDTLTRAEAIKFLLNLLERGVTEVKGS